MSLCIIIHMLSIFDPHYNIFTKDFSPQTPHFKVTKVYFWGGMAEKSWSFEL